MLSGYWLVKTFEDYLYYSNVLKNGSAVDNTAGSAVDNTAGSAVDNTAGSAVDNTAGSAVDNTAGSAVDNTAGSAVDNTACKNNYEQMLKLFNTHLFNDNTIID